MAKKGVQFVQVPNSRDEKRANKKVASIAPASPLTDRVLTTALVKQEVKSSGPRVTIRDILSSPAPSIDEKEILLFGRTVILKTLHLDEANPYLDGPATYRSTRTKTFRELVKKFSLVTEDEIDSFHAMLANPQIDDRTRKMITFFLASIVLDKDLYQQSMRITVLDKLKSNQVLLNENFGGLIRILGSTKLNFKDYSQTFWDTDRRPSTIGESVSIFSAFVGVGSGIGGVALLTKGLWYLGALLGIPDGPLILASLATVVVGGGIGYCLGWGETFFLAENVAHATPVISFALKRKLKHWSLSLKAIDKSPELNKTNSIPSLDEPVDAIKELEVHKPSNI